MADIRKRTGKNGTTYQVRYPSKATKSGYAYKSFDTLKEARNFYHYELPNQDTKHHETIRTVQDAVQRWLDVCEREGRHGRDPVSRATLEGYRYRAEIMSAYPWSKDVHELSSPDVVAFRSWLLQNHSRDLARKVLSSFHSVMLEIITEGVLAMDPCVGIAIQESRYREPVRIPTIAEMRSLLRAADDLANDQNHWIAKAWKRYRPMIYLAADTGLRPQEYLALPVTSLTRTGLNVTQAVDKTNRIVPPKSRAGRRYVPVGQDTLQIVRAWVESHDGPNQQGPGCDGKPQRYNNFLRRCWHVLIEKAGLIDEDAGMIKPRYTPYALRHFYARMLIGENIDLKTIQELMGHQDASLTLNVYGHLIRQRQAENDDGAGGILSAVLR